MDMKIYRLYVFYKQKVHSINGIFFRTSKDYFVGDEGLETAKAKFIKAKENKGVDIAQIDLCDINFDGQIVPVDRIDTFVRI